MGKEFDTAAAVALADRDAEEYPYKITINERDEAGEIVTSFDVQYGELDAAEFAVLMSDLGGRRSNLATKTAGVVDFLMSVVDSESEEYLTRRLFDRGDSFDLESVRELIEVMSEEWGARPTRQPRDFAPSQRNTGRASTRRTSASTSSRSRRTASSTPSTAG